MFADLPPHHLRLTVTALTTFSDARKCDATSLKGRINAHICLKDKHEYVSKVLKRSLQHPNFEHGRGLRTRAPKMRLKGDLCRCTAEVWRTLARVVSRVLKEFLPVFSTAFECFC